MKLAREYDRLASLVLAAGKDFNDELTFILNNAAIALAELGPQHPASEALIEMQHAAIRCASTTHVLLKHAQRASETARGAERQEALIAKLSGIDPS